MVSLQDSIQWGVREVEYSEAVGGRERMGFNPDSPVELLLAQIDPVGRKRHGTQGHVLLARA